MEAVGRALTVILALLAGFSAAAWMASAVWAFHDVRHRTQDVYTQSFATLMVLLFGPFGALLYLILRPRETLDEAYLRTLEEESMLRDFQATAGAGTGLHALNGRAPAIGVGAFIAPGAQLIGDVRVGDRASVWYNAVLRGDLAPVIIGAETNVQDGCVLHVDEGRPCIIGARVTLGHMAIVHGATIEDECLIGIQSTILSGAVIRRHSIVGAAALVAEGKAFPPNSVLLGVPAKPVREVQPEEVDHLIVARAREYAALAANELQAREGPVGPRPAEASAPRSGRGGG